MATFHWDFKRASPPVGTHYDVAAREAGLNPRFVFYTRSNIRCNIFHHAFLTERKTLLNGCYPPVVPTGRCSSYHNPFFYVTLDAML
jgi:hypothetical protein